MAERGGPPQGEGDPLGLGERQEEFMQFRAERGEIHVGEGAMRRSLSIAETRSKAAIVVIARSSCRKAA